MSETISVEVAGARLGISRGMAYKLARTGALCPGVPVIRMGRKVVVPVRAVDRVLGVEGGDELHAREQSGRDGQAGTGTPVQAAE